MSSVMTALPNATATSSTTRGRTWSSRVAWTQLASEIQGAIVSAITMLQMSRMPMNAVMDLEDDPMQRGALPRTMSTVEASERMTMLEAAVAKKLGREEGAPP
jgi:hypothetical protein